MQLNMGQTARKKAHAHQSWPPIVNYIITIKTHASAMCKKTITDTQIEK